jgi:hypothetical protein
VLWGEEEDLVVRGLGDMGMKECVSCKPGSKRLQPSSF